MKNTIAIIASIAMTALGAWLLFFFISVHFIEPKPEYSTASITVFSIAYTIGASLTLMGFRIGQSVIKKKKKSDLLNQIEFTILGSIIFLLVNTSLIIALKAGNLTIATFATSAVLYAPLWALPFLLVLKRKSRTSRADQ